MASTRFDMKGAGSCDKDFRESMRDVVGSGLKRKVFVMEVVLSVMFC